MKPKSFRADIPFFFAGVFFVGFLFIILLNGSFSFLVRIGFILATVLLMIGLAGCYRKYDKKCFSFVDSINILSGAFLGAVGTYYLTQSLLIPVVISSSIVGLAGYFFSQMLKRYSIIDLSVVIYCGTFVGMASAKVLSLPGVGIAGLLSGFLFLFLCNVLNGYGGKLGSIAFMSCVITIALIQLFHLPL